MPLTQLETELRLVARERIQQGRLPRVMPSRMWGGKGAGQCCALCDKVIQREESELEVEELVDGRVETYHFHVLCQSLWQLECVRDDYIKKHS
jgi:hypothetical protein